MKFFSLLLVTVVSLLVISSICFLYLQIKGKLHHANKEVKDIHINNHQKDQNQVMSSLITSWERDKVFSNSFEDLCFDPDWCTIKMPTVSYFKFQPPKDLSRWQLAQRQAQNGDQILLHHTVKKFSNYLDFLDGNIDFRKLNRVADMFIDQKRDFTPLTSRDTRRKLSDFKWEHDGTLPVIPTTYDMKTFLRAPVVKVGYTAFGREGRAEYFEGPVVGDANMYWREFYDMWRNFKDDIVTPFIAIHSFNENWGLLSTYFPNRTVDWGSQHMSQGTEEFKQLMEFLDHNKTLLLLVGQHSNVTHPKLVTLPRGMPVDHMHRGRMLWDTMHSLLATPKTDLVFTASSNWGHRPVIVDCISRKFDKRSFQRVAYRDDLRGRVEEGEYLRRLGLSRTGLAFSGLGADTFRLWEALTMGAVPVVEKGFGLDKTLWRLPALLVEDFDQVTPELLRTAYVEALYRADDFEFERLTQSFWWSFIANVSVTMSSQTVLDKFPLQAEDPDFARPFVPFDCWKTNSCGKGTKRVPKSSC